MNVAAHRVGDIQHFVVDRPEDDVAIFAVVLAVITPFERERIVEHERRGLEADAVSRFVLRRFASVPFKPKAGQDSTAYQ